MRTGEISLPSDIMTDVCSAYLENPPSRTIKGIIRSCSFMGPVGNDEIQIEFFDCKPFQD